MPLPVKNKRKGTDNMKLSIITVTYNRSHVIRNAIESVLKQKFKDYEYIIVDGASTDDTVSVLKEYEAAFEGRMRWISEKDNGLYDAINKGFKMARGEVVGIINSDDFFHRDDVFQIIADAFEDSTVDAIYGDDRVVSAKDPNKEIRVTRASYFRPWMYRIGLMPGHQTFYARKRCFEQLGYYKTDYKIAADFELMLRFIYVNKIRTKYVPEIIMTFREGGVSTNLSNKMLLNRETVRACRENHLFCIRPMIWLKYFYKLNRLF